ncbi:MAG: Ig-like domain-containing protein [Candidatus Hatepunaea meridiana]|nr:Ig-like domain-containing protein [Candidatus Hatepunaea meridiana]
MHKSLTLVAMMLAALAFGLIMGCEDNPSNPAPIPPGDIASIELRLTHSSIRGYEGVERTETITAIPRNAGGVALPNVAVVFAIQNPEDYKGTLVPADDDSLTDANGEAHATFTVVLERSTSVTIVAMAGNVTKSTVITIEIVDDIVGGINLEGPNVITVPQNQTASATVTASLFDLEGNALHGILVHFRTSPISLGYVDSDTGTTDVYGRAIKSFRTIVNQVGTCKIYAYIGNFNDAIAEPESNRIDSLSIDITPVAKPKFIQMFIGTQLIRVLPNQNAQVEIQTVVTDENGNGVPNIKIAFEIESASAGGQIFGSITPVSGTGGTSYDPGKDPADNREGEGGESSGGSSGTGESITNDQGELSAVFSSFGGFGGLIIRAIVLPSGEGSSGEDEIIPAEKRLTLELLTTEINSLRLRIDPAYLMVQPDTIGFAAVFARVIDLQNNGISNLQVNFQCQYGSLARPTLTDSTGLATAEYYIQPATDFEPPGAEEISDNITASILNTAFRQIKPIVVQRSVGDTGTLTLTKDVDSIYADNGLTSAKITALLKDASGRSLKDREIIFTANYGTVTPEKTTDSLGRAEVTFTDVGEASRDEDGNIVPTVITARYDPMSLFASVEITIQERYPVSTIVLVAADEQMSAGSADSSYVCANCFLANLRPAPVGTVVHFEVNNGRYTNDIVPVQGVYGKAETYYIAGQRVGTAILRAFVQNGDSLIYSNEFSISLIAGSPTEIRLRTDRNELTTNEPSVYATITATVVDTAGNQVGMGELVSFETTAGSLNNASVTTNDSGRAEVRLSPGVSAAMAIITAKVNGPMGEITKSIPINITSSGPNSIRIDADPLTIAVRGTGGVQTSTISASLFDANGNPVNAPYWIVFELLNELHNDSAANINNHGLKDSAQTSDGIARVTLNSGFYPGPKVIKAHTWRDFDGFRYDTVSVILPRVQVLSGPANQINIDVNGEGENRDGAVWAIEVAARVFDRYMNPVEDDIPVQFTCDSIATIGESSTGNESQSGTTSPGIAYATMLYNSRNTFDTLTIVAEVRTQEQVITGERSYALPLQEGVMVLHCAPTNWMIDRDDYANIRCWVELRDGHEVLINNGPILFTSNRGLWYWFNYVRNRYELYDYLDDPPEQAIKFTGWHINNGHSEHREQRGQATAYMQGEEPDFFLDPVTPEVNVQISAEVVGYEDVVADPVIVVITRHP